MPREIKFRGLRTNGNGWVYGYIQPHTNPELFDILQLNDDHDWTRYRVKPETVGQFTGLFDKNGAEIFEGDLLKRVISFAGSHAEFTEKVIFYSACFSTISVSDNNEAPMYLSNYVGHTIEVIGNIHESEVQDGK